jgi:hypothetical protein
MAGANVEISRKSALDVAKNALDQGKVRLSRGRALRGTPAGPHRPGQAHVRVLLSVKVVLAVGREEVR